jgi:hypothetical protein
VWKSENFFLHSLWSIASPGYASVLNTICPFFLNILFFRLLLHYFVEIIYYYIFKCFSDSFVTFMYSDESACIMSCLPHFCIYFFAITVVYFSLFFFCSYCHLLNSFVNWNLLTTYYICQYIYYQYLVVNAITSLPLSSLHFSGGWGRNKWTWNSG